MCLPPETNGDNRIRHIVVNIRTCFYNSQKGNTNTSIYWFWTEVRAGWACTLNYPDLSSSWQDYIHSNVSGGFADSMVSPKSFHLCGTTEAWPCRLFRPTDNRPLRAGSHLKMTAIMELEGILETLVPGVPLCFETTGPGGGLEFDVLSAPALSKEQRAIRITNLTKKSFEILPPDSYTKTNASSWPGAHLSFPCLVGSGVGVVI